MKRIKILPKNDQARLFFPQSRDGGNVWEKMYYLYVTIALTNLLNGIDLNIKPFLIVLKKVTIINIDHKSFQNSH